MVPRHSHTQNTDRPSPSTSPIGAHKYMVWLLPIHNYNSQECNYYKVFINDTVFMYVWLCLQAPSPRTHKSTSHSMVWYHGIPPTRCRASVLPRGCLSCQPKRRGPLCVWGQYLFSQTPACKRGSVSVDSFAGLLRESITHDTRARAASVLAHCCAAFAFSLPSVVIDIRAAVQCISLATKQLLAGSEGLSVLPSEVEAHLEHVCAAGCGKDLTQGHTYIPQYGDTLKYCSEECAQKVSICQRHGCALWKCG